MKEPVADLEATNIMNERQKASHISIASANLRLEKYMIDLYKEYGLEKLTVISDEDFNRLNTNERKNIYTFAKGLQECVIVALYVWQTALRNDWAELTITRKIVIPNTGNWLQINKNGTMTLILNEYKNAKYFKKQRIPLSLKSNQIMTIWLNLLERLLGAKPVHPLYYSINQKAKIDWIANAETLARQLSRISLKMFDRPATINTFRHAHEMQLQDSEEYKRMSVDEKKKAHAALLHSLVTGMKYNLLRRDE